MSIKVLPLTPDRSELSNYGKLSGSTNKNPNQTFTPQTNNFTTEQSHYNSVHDEIEYWKQKAQEVYKINIQNSLLVDEITKLTNILNQYKKDEYFRDPSRVSKFMMERDETIKQYHETQLEEIAFLKDKLKRMEYQQSYQGDDEKQQMQNNVLKQRVNELQVLVKDQQIKLDRQFQPKNYNEQESFSEVTNIKDHYAKILAQNETECEKLRVHIRTLERQKQQENFHYQQEFERLKQFYEQSKESQIYDSMNKFPKEIHNQQNQFRSSEEYDKKIPKILNSQQEYSEVQEISKRLRELEELNNQNARELFFLKTQNSKLLTENRDLTTSIQTNNSDPERADMLKLLKQAQQLCRELDREKNSLLMVVEELRFEIEILKNTDQHDIRDSNLISTIHHMRDVQTIGREEDVWRTRCNKLEKQLEIELKIKEETQQDLNYRYQFSMNQQRESYEMQIQTMKQIVDSKIEESKELRHLNQILAQQQNKQLINFQHQILDGQQQRDSRIIQVLPNQNHQQQIITINDLSAQLQNMQHLLQLKCIECDQLKSKLQNHM